MIVLERLSDSKEGSSILQYVLMFGIGLIGESILIELLRRRFGKIANLPFHWNVPESSRSHEITGILELLCDRIRCQERNQVHALKIQTSVVWTAGQGGFASTWEKLQSELDAFEAVLKLTKRLAEHLPGAKHAFHLTSSAGGLFEGQLNVSSQTAPAPRRPYGELKQTQEQKLHALDVPLVKQLYRPSSVYGFVSPRGRLGLIPTLISNGVRRQVSRIFADAQTLRDYVYVSDVGSFIADHIETESELGGVHFLASAKPTTISEVVLLLERTLDRPLYCIFRPTEENAAHNTYSAEALRSGFSSTDLATGMRSVFGRMQWQFANKTS